MEQIDIGHKVTSHGPLVNVIPSLRQSISSMRHPGGASRSFVNTAPGSATAFRPDGKSGRRRSPSTRRPRWGGGRRHGPWPDSVGEPRGRGRGCLLVLRAGDERPQTLGHRQDGRHGLPVGGLTGGRVHQPAFLDQRRGLREGDTREDLRYRGEACLVLRQEGPHEPTALHGDVIQKITKGAIENYSKLSAFHILSLSVLCVN